MNKEEVVKLATLARIDISDAEAESLSHEFEAILKYVGEVKSASSTDSTMMPSSADVPLQNVFRADDNAHESGIFSEAILKEVPAREGEYIKVKKIL
jgi:aspartyl-tRNA(Asn)/glutamyl-tRNA(Gln) amidotransferase subunit C